MFNNNIILKIRDILRLKFLNQMNFNQIAKSIDTS